jgi:hypothetical protein
MNAGVVVGCVPNAKMKCVVTWEVDQATATGGCVAIGFDRLKAALARVVRLGIRW